MGKSLGGLGLALPISEPIPVDREMRYLGHPSLGHSPTPMAEVLRAQPYHNHMVGVPGETVLLCAGQRHQVGTTMM